ncbi:hypothetical protein UFOVP1616_61 [uncultured Caudovirales phage]|uniref:Uncharacterized protein n=1 Tax=uncultured Caudovirales phage TaxID=2100421 RepID=A0A6J5SWP7_9CAUD|nr:hypothetical protein UFOVP1467_14 [uncultured Caudovirales phage]CAB4219680.1 hypothetical protein UFOVP1616_61 [uncultured Caudovirales phage]
MKKLPKWLMPTEKVIKDAKVLFKAFIKGVIIAGAGALTLKLGGGPEIAAAIAGCTHALIKIVDPTDKSIGVGVSKE